MMSWEPLGYYRASWIAARTTVSKGRWPDGIFEARAALQNAFLPSGRWTKRLRMIEGDLVVLDFGGDQRAEKYSVPEGTFGIQVQHSMKLLRNLTFRCDDMSLPAACCQCFQPLAIPSSIEPELDCTNHERVMTAEKASCRSARPSDGIPGGQLL